MAFSTWLSRASRSAGSYTTLSVTIPNGVDSVSVRLNLLANSDFSTPDKTLSIVIEISRDNGASWEHQCTISWIGGAPSPKSGGWSASINGVSAYAGYLARAQVTQTGSFRWGLQGEIV